MKTIIAGSRGINDYNVVCSAIKFSGFDITEVVSGGARGIDKLGEQWAIENNIKIVQFIPDWDIGKSAGIIRNKEMAKYADALVCIWDGVSSGSKHMIQYAKKCGLKVFVHIHDEPPVDAFESFYQ